MTSKEVVTNFWRAMATNDFAAAAAWLADDYELLWPQSSERISGPANFAAVNAAYPANGAWRFEVHRLVAEGDEVVSDVGVTDGVVRARAVTFSTVRGGKIVRQVEFWPDSYPAPEWRRRWVESTAENEPIS